MGDGKFGIKKIKFNETDVKKNINLFTKSPQVSKTSLKKKCLRSSNYLHPFHTLGNLRLETFNPFHNFASPVLVTVKLCEHLSKMTFSIIHFEKCIPF